MRHFFITHWATMCLILILFLSFFVTTYQLDQIPSGFFCDEAAVGYNAYTILTTGRDEYGTFMPLFFESFGDYKTPIEIYSTVPSVWLFGLNEFSTRIVSVVYGFFCVLTIYFLTAELFYQNKQKKIIALFTALFLAISPWEIFMSRISWESVMPFVLAVLLGTYLFLKSRLHPKLFLSSVAVFSFGMYTYFPARLFIPLFFLTLVILFRNYIPKDKILIGLSILIMILFALPFIPSLTNGSFSARLNQVSIFATPPKQETITTHIVINYLQHFSPDFLFFKGDIDMPGQFISRQSVRGIGELYLFALPLILCGFLYLFHKQKRIALLLLIWLLLYPTGSMFTVNDSPTATRSIIGVIPFTILSGVGIWYIFLLFRHIHKYFYIIGVFLFSIVIFFSFLSFLHLYFQEYPLYSSNFWGWQYGAEPVVQYFSKHSTAYSDLYMEGAFNAPYIFLKFYSPTDCKNCHIGDPTANYDPTKKQLFAITPDYFATHLGMQFRIQKIFYYPNGEAAFMIGTLMK